MVGHSGIGVVLRRLLREWLRHDPGFELALLGSEMDLNALVEESQARVNGRLRIEPWNAKIYSLNAALKRSRRPGEEAAFFAPHYATSLNTGMPLVCYVQDLIHITHPPRRGTDAYLRAYLTALRRQANYVLTPSRHVKVQLQTLFRFRPHRVWHVPLGPGIADSTPEEGGPPACEGPYFLGVGLFKRHKNWEQLLDRMTPLWRSGALTTKLVAGGLGQGRDAFLEEIRRRGIEDHVVVLERVAEGRMLRIMHESRAILFPSIAEGFGLPIVEGMMLGAPVVIAERAPMTEVAGGAALTFDPDRPESLDEAILRLDRDEELRTQLIAAGRKNSSRFSWRRTAETVAELLREVAHEKPMTPEEGE